MSLKLILNLYLYVGDCIYQTPNWLRRISRNDKSGFYMILTSYKTIYSLNKILQEEQFQGSLQGINTFTYLTRIGFNSILVQGPSWVYQLPILFNRLLPAPRFVASHRHLDYCCHVYQPARISCWSPGSYVLAKITHRPWSACGLAGSWLL